MTGREFDRLSARALRIVKMGDASAAASNYAWNAIGRTRCSLDHVNPRINEGADERATSNWFALGATLAKRPRSRAACSIPFSTGRLQSGRRDVDAARRLFGTKGAEDYGSRAGYVRTHELAD